MDGEEAEVRIGSIRSPDYLRPVYANFVNVNHTPYDFRLSFAVLRTPMPGQELEAATAEAGEIHPEGVADLIIPANLVHGLISALRSQFESYINQFGAPGLNPEGPGRTE